MRLAPVLFGALCGLAAAPLACGLDRAGTLPPPDQVTATGGYGTGAEGGSAGSGATSTGTGGTGAGGTGAGGTGGQPVGCGGGYECVAAPADATHVVVAAGSTCPAGWEAPHPLYDGTDPGCTTCSCAASAGSCTGGTVYRYDDANCTDPPQDTYSPSDDECVDVSSNDNQQADSYFLDTTLNEVGCPATDSQPLDLTIEDSCGISTPSAATCGAGNACVPSVVAGDQLCVLLSGHVTCPSGFSNPRPYYDVANDSRSCLCGCSPPSGSSCSGAHIVLWADGSCGGPSTQPLTPGDCWDASGVNWHDSYRFEAGTYQAGSCTPNDQSTGQVDFSGPVTLCCAP